MDGTAKEVNSERPTIASEKLYGKSFEAKKLEKGALIPVGGRNVFSNKTDLFVVGDFDKFTDFFQEARETASKYKLPELQKWLSAQELDIDPKLFSTLHAFTKTYEKRYPKPDDIHTERQELISQPQGQEAKLSELFTGNTVKCAEIAALAQYFLQEEGIESKYFSGEVLWRNSDEFSSPHSFIVISQTDKDLIFDPTNPTNTSQGFFPSIYTTATTFGEEVRKNTKRFITATNILSKNQAYFGVNDGTNVEEQDIV